MCASDIEATLAKTGVLMTPDAVIVLKAHDDLSVRWKHDSSFRKNTRKTWSDLCSRANVFDPNFINTMAENGIKIVPYSWISIRQGKNLILSD